MRSSSEFSKRYSSVSRTDPPWACAMLKHVNNKPLDAALLSSNPFVVSAAWSGPRAFFLCTRYMESRALPLYS